AGHLGKRLGQATHLILSVAGGNGPRNLSPADLLRQRGQLRERACNVATEQKREQRAGNDQRQAEFEDTVARRLEPLARLGKSSRDLMVGNLVQLYTELIDTL